MTTAIVDIRKFSDYIFKEPADHGKEEIFHSLGYEKKHSEFLSKIYETQGLKQFKKGIFEKGRKDGHGQRISIEIELQGIGKFREKKAFIKSGWMMPEDGNIRLLTPFSGFTR